MGHGSHIRWVSGSWVNSSDSLPALLWTTLDGVLGEASGSDTSGHKPDEFATFFSDKVASVLASSATTSFKTCAACFYRLRQLRRIRI